jgi:hypothetical protein
MATIRVQATFERASGLPEDRVVNTFHVDTAAIDLPTAAPLIAQAFDSFYTGVAQGQSAALRTIMSNVLRNLNYRMYDLADLAPRVATVVVSPLWTRPPTTIMPMPSEVALVASMYATRNLPRQRGRIYLGPLNVNTHGNPPDAESDVRPYLGVTQDLAAAMKGLTGALVVSGLRLAVYSTVDALARGVTAGWVDNAFDTQRRRGGKAATRALWAA